MFFLKTNYLFKFLQVKLLSSIYIKLKVVNIGKSILFCASFLAIIANYSCNSTNAIKLQQVEGYQKTIDASLEKDDAIEKIIAPYRASLADKMNIIIGENKYELIKEQPESSLGNFNADAILFAARNSSKDTVHAAITNYGGMRIPSMAKGDVKIGKIFELMPFGNMLVVLEMNGKELNTFLAHTVSGGGWPISKEISIKADTINKQSIFRLNGEKIEENKQYRICTSDYLANGGDKCEFLKSLQYEALGVLYREGLIEYIESLANMGKAIEAQKEGRFEYIK